MGLWLIVLEGLLFILLFGGLTLIRKEPLSVRFAVEGLAFTGLVAGLYWLTGFLLDPVLFLVLLYLIVMRSRILIDVGNLLARRGKIESARRLYGWAGRLGVEDSSKYVAQINLGACLVREKRLEEAIDVLRPVVQEAEESKLGPKYEAAARYNLGFALMRSGESAEAVRQLNEVIELLPASVYATGAMAELKRHKEAGKSSMEGSLSDDEKKPRIQNEED
jgi:tetratricopeptide (TPR) repeat protein